MGKRIGKRVAGEPPQEPNRIKKKRLTGLQKFLLAIVILLALALAAVLVWKNTFVRPELPDKTHSSTEERQEIAEEIIDYGDGIRPKAEGKRKSEDFYTILVLGRDTGGGGNTDTMLLASYDVANQKATVMSIPRDTMVNVPWDVKKINSVYPWYGGGERGIKALYKEISQLVGFEPDYKVVVEWEAVGKIVDAIGGVYFDVPYNMDYHDPYQDLVIEQAAGYRLLTGDDAMQVIRWRKNDPWSPYGEIQIGDSGRMELQQSFLKAVIRQLLTPSNIKNIGKIATVFQESVETDLSFQEILWFGQQAVSGGLGVDDVEFLTMPWRGEWVYSRSESKRLNGYFELSYVVPVAGQLLEIVNNKLSPFVEPFSRSDLDIMFENEDGSIGSTSGYVEDTEATRPPDKYLYGTQVEKHEVDENGEPVDPETGETLPESGTIVIDPESGEEATRPTSPTPKPDPAETLPQDDPKPLPPAVTEPEPEATVVPVVPQEPEESPEETIVPEFIIIPQQ